jgi:aspartate aminotransferase
LHSRLSRVFTSGIRVAHGESCAAHVSQYAALEAAAGPQDEAERMRETFRNRRDLIVRLLNDVPGVKCLMPGGAFYVRPNVTEACRMTGAATSEDLRKRLLHEAGVAVLSDVHFGMPVPGEGQDLRFSDAASTEAIEKGVARMRDYITKKRR